MPRAWSPRLIIISGLVSFDRIAAMFRLRNSETGDLRDFELLRAMILECKRASDCRLHVAGDRLNDRHGHGVAKLPVCLGIGDRDIPAPLSPLKAHESRALHRRQTPRAGTYLLDQDL